VHSKARRKKIQAIYRGENLQKYDINHCNREKKGNRHETGKNKEKNRKEQGQKQADTIQNQCTRGPRSSRQRKTRGGAAAGDRSHES
jgi:hypothetical protein